MQKSLTNTPKNHWGEPLQFDFSGVEYLRGVRGAKSFDDFPPATQRVYLRVARCFPGVQVWACGSRVRGDYVDAGDCSFVNEARKMAGMKAKPESDFDFWTTGKPVCELPENTEQVRCRVPENEKVAIPIFNDVELGQNT